MSPIIQPLKQKNCIFLQETISQLFHADSCTPHFQAEIFLKMHFSKYVLELDWILYCSVEFIEIFEWLEILF